MMDPTFTSQFGMAVQSDILRQAERDRQRGQVIREEDDMDIRFGMVGKPVAEMIMDHQREGWRQNPEEALPRWPNFDQGTPEMPQPQVSHRASGWVRIVATSIPLWGRLTKRRI